MISSPRIGVLVVDSSMVMCHLVAKYLGAADDLSVVGVARDPAAAVALAHSHHPEVVTIDASMPGEQAASIIAAIIAERPVRVVIVSAAPESEARAALRGLALGSVEYVAKPDQGLPGEHNRMGRDLVAAVRRAATTERRGFPPTDQPTAPSLPRTMPPRATEAPRPPGPAPRPLAPASQLVVIGTSTGGPGHLHALVPRLARPLDAGIIIIQHMPHSFTRSLAKRLDAECDITVREAEEGDVLASDVALMAPGDYHLLVTRNGTVHLSHEPPLHGVRPALDLTLESAALQFGSNLLAVVLTGMGVDGARGAAEVKRKGGFVFAEHESTCVVYGMPRAVIEQGSSDRVVPLFEMSEVVTSWIHARDRSLFRPAQAMKMPVTG